MTTGNSMIDTLKDFALRLDDLGIGYMVTGSFALSAYATARMTMDIDVIIEIGPNDALRFANRFLGDYYVNADSIERAIRGSSMFNIISNINGVKVDCIIRKPNSLEMAKFKRRRLSEIDGVPFWVISKEDLIISKLAWARDSLSEKQFGDIRSLVESGIDDTSLNTWIARLELRQVWDAFEKWKTQLSK